MACIGGCVSGAGVLHRSEKNRAAVDKYAKDSVMDGIGDAVEKAQQKQ
jgi:iron only hydrogenase large subunit-like protein